MVKPRLAIGSYELGEEIDIDTAVLESIREIWDSFPKFIINLTIAYLILTSGNYILKNSDLSSNISFLLINMISVAVAFEIILALTEIRDISESVSGLVSALYSPDSFYKKLFRYNILFRLIFTMFFFIIFGIIFYRSANTIKNIYSTLYIQSFVVAIIIIDFLPEGIKAPYYRFIFSPFDKMKTEKHIITVLSTVFLLIILLGVTFLKSKYTQIEAIFLLFLIILVSILTGLTLNRLFTKFAEYIKLTSEDFIIAEKYLINSRELISIQCAMSEFYHISQKYETIEENKERNFYFKAFQIIAIILNHPSTPEEINKYLWNEKSLETVKRIIEFLIEPLQIIKIDEQGRYHLTDIERKRTKAWLIKSGIYEDVKQMLDTMGIKH